LRILAPPSLKEAKRRRNPYGILNPEPKTFPRVYETRLDRQILAMGALSARKMAEKERKNPNLAVHRASLDQPICIKRTYERILDANSLLKTATKAAKSTAILPESAGYCETVEISLHPCVFRACREQLFASQDEHPYCFDPQTTGRYKNATLLLADPLFRSLEAVLNSRHDPENTTERVISKAAMLETLSRRRKSPIEIQQQHQEFLRWWNAEGAWSSLLADPARYDYRRLRKTPNKPTYLEQEASATLRNSPYSRPGSLPASSKKLSATLPQTELRIEPTRHPCFEALTPKTKQQIREAQVEYKFPASLPAPTTSNQTASDNTTSHQSTASLKSIASKSKELLEARAMQILANTVQELEARQAKIRQRYEITGVEPLTGRPSTETQPRILPRIPVATTIVAPTTRPAFAKYLKNQHRLQSINKKILQAQATPNPAETLIRASKPAKSDEPPILPALSILPNLSSLPNLSIEPTPLANKAPALKLAENARDLLGIPGLKLETILQRPTLANYQTVAPFFIAPPSALLAESFARLALSWMTGSWLLRPSCNLVAPLDAPLATNQTEPATCFSVNFKLLAAKLAPKTSHETILCKLAKQHPQVLAQLPPTLGDLPPQLAQLGPSPAYPPLPKIQAANLHAYPPSALISQLLNSPPSQQLLFAASLPHNILHFALKLYLETLQRRSCDTPIENLPLLETVCLLSYQSSVFASPGFPAIEASLQVALAGTFSKLFLCTCRRLQNF
jgi:hypothetical protein